MLYNAGGMIRKLANCWPSHAVRHRQRQKVEL
nr:MAG TPA: hypothetical protein [Caudoviricetes sp.]